MRVLSSGVREESSKSALAAIARKPMRFPFAGSGCSSRGAACLAAGAGAGVVVAGSGKVLGHVLRGDTVSFPIKVFAFLSRCVK